MADFLNEYKWRALVAQGFNQQFLNEKEWAWLASLTGSTDPTLAGQWGTLLASMGYTSGSPNERQMASWKALGYTGTWNEMATLFWMNGGMYVAAVAPIFTGTIPAQSWTVDVAITPLATAPYFGSPSPAPVFTISAGALPAGVTIDSATGIISGTPTAITTGSFTVRATNSAGLASSNSVAWTVASAVVLPNFHALVPDPLTYEMQLLRVGAGTATAAHTSLAYAPDVDGLYTRFRANEPIWSGGRTVRNCINLSEDFSSSQWLKTSLTPTYGVTDPLGGTKAVRLTATANGGLLQCTPADYPLPNPNPMILSCWMRSVSGSGLVQMNSDITPIGLALDGTWKRYSVMAYVNQGSGNYFMKFYIRVLQSGDVIEIAFPQLEQVRSVDALTVSPTELLVNGGFSADTDWTKSAGWTISGGKLIASGMAQFSQTTQVITGLVTGGKSYRIRAVVDAFSGGGTLNLDITWGTNPTGYSSTTVSRCPAAGVFDAYFTLTGINSGTVTFAFAASGSSQAFTIDSISLREVTAGDVPGEYVPTTTLNVTAFKTFANASGNSVAAPSRVVTEAVGAPLAEMPYLQYYPAMTNACLYSNDQTNAWWTKTNITVLKSVFISLTDYIPGIDGSPASCTRLTATGANATCIGTAVVAASGVHTGSFYLKRITGTGQISVTLDGGTTWNNITLTAAFTKFNIQQSALVNPVIGIRMATSGDVIDVGNVELYLTQVNNEERNYGIGPIFTTSAAVATVATVYQVTGTSVQNVLSAAWFLEGIQQGRSANYVIAMPTSGRGLTIDNRTGQEKGAISLTPTTNVVGTANSWLNNTYNRLGVSFENNGNGSMRVQNTGWATPFSPAQGLWGQSGSTSLYIHATNTVSSVKLRNLRQYNITTYAEGQAIIDGLMV